MEVSRSLTRDSVRPEKILVKHDELSGPTVRFASAEAHMATWQYKPVFKVIPCVTMLYLRASP